MRWLLTCWAAVVLVLVGCASHRVGTTTATHHAGQTALEVVIRLGLAQPMAAAAREAGTLSPEEYRRMLLTIKAGNEAALALAESLAEPPDKRQVGDRAIRVLGVVLPLLAEQLGTAGAKIAELSGSVRQIHVQQAREDAALLALLRERAQANLAANSAELDRIKE